MNNFDEFIPKSFLLVLTLLIGAVFVKWVAKDVKDFFGDTAEAGILDQVTEHEMKHAYCYTVGIAHEKLVCIPKEMK